MRGKRENVARIGPVALGAMPRVVATLMDDADRAHATAAWKAGADLLELRLDGFHRLDAGSVSRRVQALRRAGLPLIATIRRRAEGGRRAIPDPMRLSLFEAVLPWVEAVDIELKAAIFRPVVEAAQRAGKTVIVSYHNLKTTPPRPTLDRIVRRAARHGVVKIATMVRTPTDVLRLARLLRRRRRLIVIGLGPAGAVSRVTFPLLGSPLTYGHVGRAGAPGQLHVQDMIEALRRYDPVYDRAVAGRIRRRTTGPRGPRSSP